MALALVGIGHGGGGGFREEKTQGQFFPARLRLYIELCYKVYNIRTCIEGSVVGRLRILGARVQYILVKLLVILIVVLVGA